MLNTFDTCFNCSADVLKPGVFYAVTYQRQGSVIIEQAANVNLSIEITAGMIIELTVCIIEHVLMNSDYCFGNNFPLIL
jgi:hypothetical protein